MSGATYRIEVRYESEMSPGSKWRGKVYRAADDSFVGSVFRDTPENAALAAREYVAAMQFAPDPVSFYVDDEGQDADAPHSVKA